MALTNSDLLMSTSGPSSAISNSGKRDVALYSLANILAILFMDFLMLRSWTDAGSHLPSQMDVLSDAPDSRDTFPSSDVSMLWDNPSYDAMFYYSNAARESRTEECGSRLFERDAKMRKKEFHDERVRREAQKW